MSHKKIRRFNRGIGRCPAEVRASAIARADAEYVRELTGNSTEHPSLVEQKEAFGDLSEDQLRIAMCRSGISKDA